MNVGRWKGELKDSSKINAQRVVILSETRNTRVISLSYMLSLSVGHPHENVQYAGCQIGRKGRA